MGLFDWLFGRKERPAPSTGPQQPQPRPEREQAPAAVTTPTEAAAPPTDRPTPRSTPALVGPAPNGEDTRPAAEADNLRRWKESGQPRAWVEAHKGTWGHQEWLALLAALERSSYWPMHADAIGLTLEETKREWLRRN